jgi:hypothetical protein
VEQIAIDAVRDYVDLSRVAAPSLRMASACAPLTATHGIGTPQQR